MPWYFDVSYGDPVCSTVKVELDRASYNLAIKTAEEQGHRPKRCRVVRAEYSHFVPSSGSYGTPEYVNPKQQTKTKNKK